MILREIGVRDLAAWPSFVGGALGLEGVEGDAVGHEGYGIHGTIAPDSIGKAVSLGCIRMHNESCGFLYKVLMPAPWTVPILP